MSASDKVVLAEVVSGWTGSVVITGTAATRTVTPDGRTSAAEIWETLVRELARAQGQSAYGWADSSLKLHLQSGAGSFTLTASGTTQSRLKLTGTYSGVTTLATASAVDNLVAPESTAVNAAPVRYLDQPPAGDGVLGVAPTQRSAPGALAMADSTAYSLTNMVAVEEAMDDGGTYDVFLNGRVYSRFRAGGVRRVRNGRKATFAMLNLKLDTVLL